MSNLNFDKYIKGGSSDTKPNISPANTTVPKDTKVVSTPPKTDVGTVKLKDSKSTTIETSKGKIKLRETFKKIIYGAAVVGTTLGLAATGFGAANLIAIAALPQFSLISFDTLTFGIMTGVGYKLTKATLGTTMKNTPKLKPIYDAFTGAKEELEEKRSKK